jgi:hypothetical protein
VSSILYEVLSHFETKVEEAIPTIRKSRQYYNTSSVDDVNNGHTYAVRPGSASPTSGTLRSVTIEQEVELQITKEYVEKGATDQSIRAAVETLMLNHEAVLNIISFHSISGVQIIQHPSFSAPEIDEARKLVSITFTYPVIYRKFITGS